MDRHDWDARYAAREDLVWSGEPNATLVAEAGGLPPGRALDLACGEGRSAVWLASLGWQVAGVDFSREGLRKARALAEARGVSVEWFEADLLEYAPEPGAFDLVLLLYLQLPADERRVVLARAAGALAPGGTLLFIAHDLDNLEHGHGGPGRPEVLSTPEGVVADLSGMAIERAERIRRRVALPDGGEAVAIDTLVRARRA